MKIRIYTNMNHTRYTEVDVTRVDFVLGTNILRAEDCRRSTEALRLRLTDGVLLMEPRMTNDVVLIPVPSIYRITPLFETALPAPTMSRAVAVRMAQLAKKKPTPKKKARR